MNRVQLVESPAIQTPRDIEALPITVPAPPTDLFGALRQLEFGYFPEQTVRAVKRERLIEINGGLRGAAIAYALEGTARVMFVLVFGAMVSIVLGGAVLFFDAAVAKTIFAVAVPVFAGAFICLIVAVNASIHRHCYIWHTCQLEPYMDFHRTPPQAALARYYAVKDVLPTTQAYVHYLGTDPFLELRHGRQRAFTYQWDEGVQIEPKFF